MSGDDGQGRGTMDVLERNKEDSNVSQLANMLAKTASKANSDSVLSQRTCCRVIEVVITSMDEVVLYSPVTTGRGG